MGTAIGTVTDDIVKKSLNLGRVQDGQYNPKIVGVIKMI